VDRAGLETGERAQLFLSCLQRCKCLARSGGEQAAGLGEAAGQRLVERNGRGSRRRLEQAHVLTCGRLPDPDASRGRRNGSLALDLDEQAEAGGVPEERERCIGHNDDRYRKIRLAPY
jgi:hypothetical protein